MKNKIPLRQSEDRERQRERDGLRFEKERKKRRYIEDRQMNRQTGR